MRFVRRFNDIGINGFQAKWYDRDSRNHRINEFKNTALKVAKHIGDGASVLEIAPGPGYLAIEIAKLGMFKIVGMDISEDFVNIARKNAKEACVDVEFQQGNVSNMPFTDSTFDFIVCTAAFKNFKDPAMALNEMQRVLKKNGTVLIIDMNRNISTRQIGDCVKEMNLKPIAAFSMR